MSELILYTPNYPITISIIYDLSSISSIPNSYSSPLAQFVAPLCFLHPHPILPHRLPFSHSLLSCFHLFSSHCFQFVSSCSCSPIISLPLPFNSHVISHNLILFTLFHPSLYSRRTLYVSPLSPLPSPLSPLPKPSNS